MASPFPNASHDPRQSPVDAGVGPRLVPQGLPKLPGDPDCSSDADATRRRPPHRAGRLNPVLAASASLLEAVRDLATSTTAPELEALRAELILEIRRFDQACATAAVPAEQALASRYVLCSVLDEAIGGTSWGPGSGWSRRTLLVTFHNDAYGGEKVYQLLARLAESPRKYIDVLELIHVTLSLGFRGRFLSEPEKADQWRERLARLIRETRGPVEHDLSPDWRPPAVARTSFAGKMLVPPAILVTAILLACAYAALTTSLERTAAPVVARIAALSPAAATRTTVAPAARRVAGLAELLAPQIRSGLVDVHEDADSSVVTLLSDGVFPSGGASIPTALEPLFASIAAALRAVPGTVRVTGHTDDQPIASTRHPSNWHLSRARAMSVVFLLVEHGVPARRLNADGRGDAEPIASNRTREGRARNRRVEITLTTAAGGS